MLLLTLEAAQYHVTPPSLFLSPSTTALTVDNVIRELKDVTWKILCVGDSGEGGVLFLPPSQQLKIEKEYTRENQRRNVAVHFWLFNDPYASRRRLITRLDFYREHVAANCIRDYAEKLTGICWSVPCVVIDSYSIPVIVIGWSGVKCLHEVHVKVLSIHVYELCSHACTQSPTWNETR